jgi:PKHD-type hydroxylase
MTIIRHFTTEHRVEPSAINEDYVPYVWLKKVFSDVEVANVLSLWSTDKAHLGMIGKSTLDPSIRNSAIQFIEVKDNEWLYDKLAMTSIMINSSKYKFDILGFACLLQLAQYGQDGFYEWHADIGKGDTSQRKLSISVQLSDPDEYEGGELQLMNGGEYLSLPKDRGSVVIFPSYVMHRVQPISKGLRRSLVGWIGGPTFR